LSGSVNVPFFDTYLGPRKLRILGQNSHTLVLTSYRAATRLPNDLTPLLRGVVFVGQSELDRRFSRLAEFAASIERQMMVDARFWGNARLFFHIAIYQCGLQRFV
jgi:hypothetical protein